MYDNVNGIWEHRKADIEQDIANGSFLGAYGNRAILHRKIVRKDGSLITLQNTLTAGEHWYVIGLLYAKAMQAVQEFETAYVTALLWVTPYGDSEYFDQIASGIEEFDGESQKRIKAECAAFIAQAGALIAGNHSQAGHDFALTRNGHGTGFWDRPEMYGGKAKADKLTALAGTFKAIDLYTNDGVTISVE